MILKILHSTIDMCTVFIYVKLNNIDNCEKRESAHECDIQVIFVKLCDIGLDI